MFLERTTPRSGIPPRKSLGDFFRVLPAAAFGLWMLTSPASLAAQSTPLLMNGKDTLYQRVLVRERTIARATPGAENGSTVMPLTALYVYERLDGWLQVAAGEDGSDLFWIPEDSATDWKQTIVATIEASENVGRLLFFKNQDPLYDLLDLESPGLLAGEYRGEAEAAEKGGTPSETVVALGPRKVIDQKNNLYVMPILDFEEEVFDNGTFVNLLKVAVARADGQGSLDGQTSFSDTAKPIGERSAGSGKEEGAEDENYQIGVVFVVDTTISMDPYIKATRAALQDVYEEVRASGLSDAVSFGLIGYRDNIAAAPGLEYATRTFVTLEEGLEGDKFLAGIDTMNEARSSSKNFREDSYAGVEHALDTMGWGPFDGRFIVLVSDAGPREVDDEYSQTGLSAKGLNALVRERLNGAIAVMHLKTPKGQSDHDRAEAAYRDLATFPNLPPLYFPIENGDPETFRREARDFGKLLTQDVLHFRTDPAQGIESGLRDITEGPVTADPRLDGVRSVSRTMQLAFLGRTEGAKAPDVFEAYVADRDFERTGLKPLSMRVLISKAQLSALYDAMNTIIEKGEENIVDPDQFFAQVLGAAADMSRSPDKVSRQSDPSLAQAVAIDDYIEDLPYRSRIMSVTEDDWLDMSFSEQAAIMNELYDKIRRYEQYNEATDLWVDYLGTGAKAQNLLYPMPLDDLP